jgi:serine/threonine-protein kinase
MKIEKKIGRYEVVSVVGRGAMGTVYKALDPLIERTVAIKTISLDFSATERAEFEERFFREAKSAGRLSHPNIVTIYDVGETEDEAFIAMEFLEGQSLRELLDSGVVLEIPQICRIAKRIASALDYAHSNQVVHRDIKPGNIMIGRNREIKIMDFGIAKVASDARTIDGTLLGSPKYMAPEQILGQPVDGRADLFALGAVLYEMLTGRAPFSGDNLNTIMYKIVNEDPMRPSKVTSLVPAEFDAIIARALAKRPEKRYQSARSFGNDLQKHERSAPPASRQVMRPPALAPRPATLLPARGETTVRLAPRTQSRTSAMYGRLAGFDVRDAVVRLRRLPRRSNYLLFAIPVVATVAFAVFLQMNPPYEQAAQRSLGAVPDERGADATAIAPRRAVQPVAAAGSIATVVAAPDAAASPVTAPAGAAPATSSASVAAPSGAVASDAPSGGRAAPAGSATQASSRQAFATEHAKPTPATMHLAVAPWGMVYVDGKSAGVTPPLKRLRLAPGSHTLEIRNAEFPPFRKTVNASSGKSLSIRHTFK